MARRELSRVLGDAILNALELGLPAVAKHLDRWLRVLGESVRPSPPMTIRASDGSSPTGLLVVDRGRVLVFAGIREAVTPPPPPAHRRPSFDDDLLFEDPVYGRWPR